MRRYAGQSVGLQRRTYCRRDRRHWGRVRESIFWFGNTNCSLKDTNDAKKSLIEGRKGPNWELKADSTGVAGELQAEYILDGRNIRVGSEDGAKAGKAIADDLVSTTVNRFRVLYC